MKKTIFLMAACLPVLTSLNSMAATTVSAATTNHITVAADWMKSPDGTWPGMKDGKTYWYKLDKKGGLWWSMDGKQWAAVKEGAWADKDGKWLKIHDKKLVWSTDGKAWAEVPDWQWQGSDGKWYKFDKSWGLWVK
ncbi:MAG: hypothetical protein QM731_28300 [Chitinophagaceae bacterium]